MSILRRKGLNFARWRSAGVLLEVDLVMEGKMGRKVGGRKVRLGVRGKIVFVKWRRVRNKCLWL